MKYEITKEQIIEIYEYCNNSELKNTIKEEWFPEAFKKELKLETGKWYVGYHYADRFLSCITLTDELETHDLGYGFNKYNGWTNNLSFLKTFDYGFELATESEVFEALKNEAKKRGYKNGNHYCLNSDITEKNVKDDYIFDDGYLWYGTNVIANCVFQKGKWAEILETISKQDAEKIIGKIII